MGGEAGSRQPGMLSSSPLPSADARLLKAWASAGVVALSLGGPQLAMFAAQVRV